MKWPTFRFTRPAARHSPSAPPRPRQPTRGATAEVRRRFGDACPVCNQALGRTAVRDDVARLYVDPPSLRLEVGQVGEAGIYPWRVQSLDGNPGLIYLSENPPFAEYDSDFVYVLCMNGHIFPDSAPLYRVDGSRPGDESYRIDRWRMVAAIGPSGSGKTYLVLRTLEQSLVNPQRIGGSDTQHVLECELTPLEEIPRKSRLALYNETLSMWQAIPATQLHSPEGTPRGLLEETMPDVLSAIGRIIAKSVTDGARRAGQWGGGLRQPLVLRTRFGERRTWTGVADLPGEQFLEIHENRRENARLGLYDALIWVIDPVLANNATDWFPPEESGDDTYDKILEGSLRPGSVNAGVDTTRIRLLRNIVQQRIGRRLGLVDGRFNPRGSTLSTLVAINKCDVIHRALAHRDLTKFGEEGAVLKGMQDYLLVAAKLWRERRITADDEAARLLDHVSGGLHVSDHVRAGIAASFAAGLAAHYSAREAFWNLVHGGIAVNVVEIGAPGDDDRWILTVPTIGDHMDGWNANRDDRHMLTRDLVMSVIGCGLAYGLGYAESVLQLLSLEAHETRFFLCSPLATVPVARDGSKLMPLEGGRFPDASARSAALTQLLLAILGRADG